MASILKVDKLDPQSGTDLEIGTSGDTVSIPSGATLDISSATLTPPATMPASSGVNLTALNATNLGSGTVPTARLGTGTASSSTVLYGDQTYKAEPGGGKVLQVVSDTFTQGNWQTCSSSYVTAAGFDLSITPAATTSKILLLANAYVHSQYNTDTVDWAFYRDSTQIKLGNHNLKGDYDQYHNLTFIYIDSPSSTSSISYTLKFHPNGTGCVQLRSNGQNSFILMEIGA